MKFSLPNYRLKRNYPSSYNAVELCKNNNGVEFIETRLTFAQGLVTGLTYSIYAPRTVNVYCKDN